MTKSSSSSSSLNRSGFTLIELLVCIGIISMLLALLIPAVRQSRAAARRMHCLSNLRQVGFAMLVEMDVRDRFPACGNFGKNGSHHSWVVDILPGIDQSHLAAQWDKDKPYADPQNRPLANTHIAVLTCPSDITVLDGGDLSYVVNGGVGFTIQDSTGVHDCPIHPDGSKLDLNGNGVTCPPDSSLDGSPSDKDDFVRMGLFFNETWKWDVTRRHHRPASVTDGMSHTLMISENVRTGFDPDNPDSSWGSSNPYLTSFYIGNPCLAGNCSFGNVDYALANSGPYAINSGIGRAEGTSPIPNSFHKGGVNMVYCDGHARFLSQHIDGMVYASLASPQGAGLANSLLAQTIVSGDY